MNDLDRDVARTRAALETAVLNVAANPDDEALKQRRRRLECALDCLLWSQAYRRQARRAVLLLGAHWRVN